MLTMNDWAEWSSCKPSRGNTNGKTEAFKASLGYAASVQ